MKAQIFILFLLLIVGNLLAQPVLTSSNFSPKPGDVNLYYNCDTTGIMEGSSGVNQIWNFSGLAITGGWVDTVSYYAFLDSSITDTFPNYDVIGVNYFGFYNLPAYIYYDRNDSFIWAGTYHYYPFPPAKFAALQLNMLYPFTYGTSFSNSLLYYPTLTHEEWDTVACDGYGKLITPFATYDSVLRIHLKGFYFDTTGGSYPHVKRMAIDSFAWFTPGIHGALLGVTKRDVKTQSDTFTTKTVTLGKYYHTTSTKDKLREINLELFPNPTSESMTVRFELTQASDLEIDIYSIEGKKIATNAKKHYVQGKHDVSFDLRLVPSGCYVCNLIVNGIGVLVRKIEVR
jgi:hypothetical protein